MAQRIQRQRGSGAPLDPGLRTRIESSFQTDFSGVRVHTGSEAADLNGQLAARAFTTGSDIFLGPGVGSSDQETLAHELTHVVQQRSMPSAGSLSVGAADDGYEREAAEVASTVVSGSPAPAVRQDTSIGRAAIQREPAANPYLGAHKEVAWSQSTAPNYIQRFEGPEHARLGNVTGLQIDLGNGVVLDWGQVVAIAGDEVGSEDELRDWATSAEGKQKIMAALQNAEVADGGVHALPAPTPKQKEEQETRYHLLLLDNVSHFAEGGTALDTWRAYHLRAIGRALELGVANPAASVALDDAYLAEAFGQHFLTDMFSGGHLRTPRQEIFNYYVGTFAPRVLDTLLLNLRQRLEDGIYAQASEQSKLAWLFEGRARDKIRARLDDLIAQQIAKLQGGRQELADYLGKALAGIISGAIHDADGRRGVVVASQAHPESWTAKGDGELEANGPVSKEQAEAAVLAGLNDVNRAFAIGQREGALKALVPSPAKLPSRVFFKFASADVASAAVPPIDEAAAFLAYNPDSHLELVGHTDPIGTDAANDTLGMQRAEAVAAQIAGHALDGSRFAVSSMGEHQLVTTDPRQYARDRRVEFIWTEQPGAASVCQDEMAIALERAQQAVLNELGPPFNAVEQYIPHVVPGANPELPDWRWDSMSPDLKQQIKDWVSRRFSPDLQAKLLGSDMLATQKVDDIEVDPRPIVEGMLKEVQADPTQFLDSLFAPYLGPPDFSPD